MSTTDVHPFSIEIPQQQLDGSRDRLDRIRWSDESPDAGWNYGIPPDSLEERAEYWRHDYDWRAHEVQLNEFPPFTTTIEGQT